MISSNSTPLTKICKQCDIEKPMFRFYRTGNGRGIGGRRAECKDCTRKYLRNYNKSDAGKERMNRYCEANPHKRRAKDAIHNAIRAGNIPPVHTLTCEHCDAQADHRHHPDYSKPLETIPLCRPCHVQLHNQPQETTA